MTAQEHTRIAQLAQLYLIHIHILSFFMHLQCLQCSDDSHLIIAGGERSCLQDLRPVPDRGCNTTGLHSVLHNIANANI